MKKLALALLLAMTTAAAGEPATPSPRPAPSANVALTDADMRVIAAALHIAAGACDSNVTACQVGEFKDGLIAKLQAAENSLNEAKRP